MIGAPACTAVRIEHMDSSYTYEMFTEDSLIFNRLHAETLDIKVPEDEWPVAEFTDLTYRVDQNMMETRLVNFMREKYGEKQGTDFSWRLMCVWALFRDHQEGLREESLIWDEEGTTLIDEDFIRMLLGSMRAPEPPRVLPVSELFGVDAPEFDIEKVIGDWDTH